MRIALMSCLVLLVSSGLQLLDVQRRRIEWTSSHDQRRSVLVMLAHEGRHLDRKYLPVHYNMLIARKFYCTDLTCTCLHEQSTILYCGFYSFTTHNHIDMRNRISHWPSSSSSSDVSPWPWTGGWLGALYAGSPSWRCAGRRRWRICPKVASAPWGASTAVDARPVKRTENLQWQPQKSTLAKIHVSSSWKCYHS